MTGRANTRLTFYRTPSEDTAPPDTPRNPWGELQDVDHVHLSGVIAGLQQETVRQWQPSEHRMTEVTSWVARIRRTYDVRDTDRVLDEKTGARFVIEEIHTPTSYAGWAKTRLQLKKVD
ncbi:hypothetical protein ACWFMI_23555 [Nocardiopsis terrae]|uniref:hypothetical protein n=1 Tax=Streptomyces sp. NPDC057554 TaxID=3350538 RepID=UPI00368657DB